MNVRSHQNERTLAPKTNLIPAKLAADLSGQTGAQKRAFCRFTTCIQL